MLGIGTDNADKFFLARFGAANDDSAFVADFFDRSADFHVKSL